MNRRDPSSLISTIFDTAEGIFSTAEALPGKKETIEKEPITNNRPPTIYDVVEYVQDKTFIRMYYVESPLLPAEPLLLEDVLPLLALELEGTSAFAFLTK